MDDQYVTHYNPRIVGASPTGLPLQADLQVSPNVEDAMHFQTSEDARAEWMRWDGTLRGDGKPSRPMTAFNISVFRLK
jgi:hypothetical protein